MEDYVAQAMALAAMAKAKGSASDTYTKAQTDALIDGKADLVGGKVPASQLPSYVDDVAEGYMYQGRFYSDAQHTQEITGEEGKIYLDLATNTTYRWSGNAFVPITGQADWNQTDTNAPDYIKNKPGITDTATQGSADLITSGGVYTILGNINAVLEEVL